VERVRNAKPFGLAEPLRDRQDLGFVTGDHDRVRPVDRGDPILLRQKRSISNSSAARPHRPTGRSCCINGHERKSALKRPQRQNTGAWRGRDLAMAWRSGSPV